MLDPNYKDASLSTAKVGYYAAISSTIITIVTFGFALIAIPISGSNCPGDCIHYPYLDSVAQYPNDFLWMYMAMFLILAYLILMISIHVNVQGSKKIYSQIGLTFSIISSSLLLIDYYLQFSIIPVSLLSNETEGLALLIQYNPHGIFIALEELGYIMMSISFLFMAFVFSDRTRLEISIRWTFLAGFTLSLLSLIAITLLYGLEKLDRFEVFIISIDWLVLIIMGILLSIFFKRHWIKLLDKN